MDLSPETIARFLTAYVVLLFSLSFHESAHAWMASRLGDQTARDQGRVSLNPLVHIDPIGTVLMPLLQVVAAGIPLLAWAKPTPVVAANFRPGLFRRGQVLAAAAGPGVFALEVLYLGVILNVALGVFNLVPLPPLDGSWIASFGLPRNLGEAYDRYVRPYGTMILLLLVVSGGLGELVRPIMTGLHDLLFRLALPA